MAFCLLSTVKTKNSRLQFQLSKKIPGIKQEYTSLTSLIDKITWLPKTVNLYLIKKTLPKHKKRSEIIADITARLKAVNNSKIKINIHFVCDVELELDEDALEGVC